VSSSTRIFDVFFGSMISIWKACAYK